MQILFEDNYLLVIDKPAGLQVERDLFGNPNMEDRVGEYLREKYPWKKQLITGVVHRLDRPVSGVLVFAKTPNALKVLNAQFAERKVCKIYHALTGKAPAGPAGELVHWLRKDDEKRQSIVSSEKDKKAKLAKLKYRLLPAAAGENLLEIELLTGRYHQIRAQLAAIGCPILGDEKYGSPVRLPSGQIALRCQSIEFFHPKTGEAIKVQTQKRQIDIRRLMLTIPCSLPK